MVISVMGGTIDNFLQYARNMIVPIMDGDCPDIDEDIEAQIGHLVQGKKEWVDVIRDALKEAIHGVKSMACKWSWDLPQVMGLVQTLWEKREELEP